MTLKHILSSIRHISLAWCAIVAVVLFMLPKADARAAAQITGVQVTDVTPRSFSVIWLSDVPAGPDLWVYSDADGQNQINAEITIEPMPVGKGFEAIQEVAEERGVLKARATHLKPATPYYYKIVTTAKDGGVTVSDLMGPVTTAAEIVRAVEWTDENSRLVADPFANDIILFNILESDGATPAPGSLLVFAVNGSPYPLSAYVGDGIAAPGVLIDLNNAYGSDYKTYRLQGKERVILKELRSGSGCVLTHFRLVPSPGGICEVRAAVKGEPADINVDNRVGIMDFSLFAEQYGTTLSVCEFNIDYDLAPDGEVSVEDFSIFSQEYGKTYE